MLSPRRALPLRALGLLVLLTTVLPACGGPLPEPPRPVTSGADLLREVARHGYQAEPQPRRDEDPLLHTGGRVYAVAEAGTLVLYEYPSEAAADADALTVAGRGAQAEPGALFQRGALLVLYLGQDAGLARLLERALGPPRY